MDMPMDFIETAIAGGFNIPEKLQYFLTKGAVKGVFSLGGIIRNMFQCFRRNCIISTILIFAGITEEKEKDQNEKKLEPLTHHIFL